jgi:hypothetical protein
MSQLFQLPVAQFVRKSLLALLFCLAFVAIPSQAHAAVSPCRGDPIIFLSDGTRVRITVVIGVTAAEVSRVDYTVHVPAGLTVTRIVTPGANIPGSIAGKEFTTVIADLPAGQYTTSTVATTTTPTYVEVTGLFPGSGKLVVNGASGVAIPLNYTQP